MGKRKGVDVRKGVRRKFNLEYAHQFLIGDNGDGRPKTMFYVYLLIDPVTLYVGYIGVTKDPTSRSAQHRRDVRVGKTEKDEWLRLLRDWGREAKFHIIAACPTLADACVVERALIKKHNLSNTIHKYKGEEVQATYQYSFLAGKYFDEDDVPY